MLIIKFKKKKLYINLALGVFWVILGTLSIWKSDEIRWTRYLYIIIGLLYLGMAAWNYKYHYLTITDSYIKTNSLFAKKILLQDLTLIKKFTDEYTLKTANKNLGINTSLMEKESKIAFETFIKTIELPLEAPLRSK